MKDRKKYSEVWVISDIHGHYDLFVELLNKIGFMSGNNIISDNQFKDRMLVLGGDYIDRGDKPLETLYLLETLVGHGAKAILGNHDNWLKRKLNGASPFMNEERMDTLTRIEKSPKFRSWSDVKDILSELPYWEDVDGIKFAHAIYSDSGAKGKGRGKRDYMLYGPTDRNAPPNENGHPVRIPWYETYDGRYGKVVFGHYSLSDKIEEFPNAVCVDCGTYKTGVMGAYEIHSGRKVYVSSLGDF